MRRNGHPYFSHHQKIGTISHTTYGVPGGTGSPPAAVAAICVADVRIKTLAAKAIHLLGFPMATTVGTRECPGIGRTEEILIASMGEVSGRSPTEG